MLHSLADAQHFEHELIIHLPFNSWMAEAQWHSLRPSECGFVENERTSWSEASAASVGTWSTEKYLPMAMAENTRLGVIWFWQIEHNGSWYWEISNSSLRGGIADDVYAYLGGPDDLHSAAWKNLKPGETYETVPVAVGCLQGGFGDAVEALTRYRRVACEKPRKDNLRCPVIFNDYMNCLLGDPTTEKEMPLIEAAARAGCEYFVIDAGWYAERNEKWWESVGLWQPSRTRWGPGGLGGVLEAIRSRGMVPGLWLEIEVAGIHSPLKDKPDAWFMNRHGARVIDHGRYLLDFRNPEVRAYADGVVDRIVGGYGVGYLKMDYNVDALLGTERDADSPGQGLLEHQRAYLGWIDGVHARYPALVIENCGSGGGRMDYAMLSHHQLQSSSDQRNYRLYPSIVAGALAAVLPEQLGVWAYPKKDADADAASFNMVNAMLARIHQSGAIAELRDESWREVREGIRIYKENIRPDIPRMVPFLPLGLPSMADTHSPVAVGLRGAARSLIAVWRLDGDDDTVRLPVGAAKGVSVLYPTDLGIVCRGSPSAIEVRFPRRYMGAILEVR